MIVVVNNNAAKEQFENLVNWIESQNVRVHVSTGEYQTVLGLIGDTSRIDTELLEGLDIVSQVTRVTEPFKNANRKFHPENTVIDCGSSKIGNGHFGIIAGPCSIESEEQIIAVAKSVKEAGADFLRGGAFKPRTSPYDFQAPMSQLLKMAGCQMEDNPKRGGQVPVCDEYGRTSLPGVFVAGDVSGIEEASSAMIEGRMAGIVAAEYLGYVGKEELDTELSDLETALDGLRQGMFAPKNRGKAIEETEEGIDISTNLLKKGYVADDEIERFPGVTHKKGIHPVIECTQNIPCNPCQDACPKKCISIGDNITSLPIVVPESDCINCGMCVASCSGQAIFLVDEDCGDGTATVTLPYEFLPLPEKGTKGIALGRDGNKVCEAEVVSVKSTKAFDKTNLLTMRVPKEYAMTARFFKAE